MEFPTIDKFAKEVAEKALDEITYDGKTIREWVEIIVKTQPCEDCISRQVVIEYITANYGFCHNLIDWVKDLPSVTPERPKGKWIDVNDNDSHGWGAYKCHACSECKDYYTTSAYEMKYCPNCGAYMKEDSE